MKKLLITMVFVFGSLPHLHAQQFTYFQCSPVTCQEYYGPVYTGDVGVDAYATCSNYIGNEEVHPNATAVACVLPVTLAATVTKSTTMGLDDQSCVVYTDRMSGNGGAFLNTTQYWRMYQKRGCDGEYDDYIQPPAAC